MFASCRGYIKKLFIMVRVLCQNSVGGGCCRGQMEELTPEAFMEGKSCSVIDAAMATRAAEALNAHSEDSNSNFSSDFNNSGNSDSFSDSDMETKVSLSIDMADPTSDKKQVNSNGQLQSTSLSINKLGWLVFSLLKTAIM